MPIQDTLADTRNAILPRRHAALADKGLVPVLREYVDGWSRRTGITAERRVQGERASPLGVEDVVFRIA